MQGQNARLHVTRARVLFPSFFVIRSIYTLFVFWSFVKELSVVEHVFPSSLPPVRS